MSGMRPIHKTNREFHITTKAAYLEALKTESVAKRLDLNPAFWIAEKRLEIARRRGDLDGITHAREVVVLMMCREFFSRYALYLLTD